MGSENNMVAVLREAGDLLSRYAEFIHRDVKANELERHPYLPAIEECVINLDALARLAQPDAQQGASSPASGEGVDADQSRVDYCPGYCARGEPHNGPHDPLVLHRQSGGQIAEVLATPLAAATQPAVPQEGETWESIAEWCETTFGPCSPMRMAQRAAEEMDELRDETTRYVQWTDKGRIEAADVLICLSRVPGIWRAVEEKMRINRARTWDVKGDGTGYHIRPALTGAGENGEQGA